MDRDYAGDPMFRPRRVTPGHTMEWARLLVQLWEIGDRQHFWMLGAAEKLFLTACETGWDVAQGGFYYTLNWEDKPDHSAIFGGRVARASLRPVPYCKSATIRTSKCGIAGF